MKQVFTFLALLSSILGTSQNLIDSSGWVSGTSGTTANFSSQGSVSQNSRIDMTGPYGNQATVWQAEADGASGMNGGFSHTGLILDTDKSYRFTFWMRSSGANNCTNYTGFVPRQIGGSLIQPFSKEDGGSSSWPYFSSINLPNDQWFLVVAYIRPSGSSDSGTSGIYDPSQGSVSNLPASRFEAMDFIFPTNVSQIRVETRSFMWSCGSGEKMFIYDPRVEELATEISLAQVLYGTSNTTDSTSPTSPNLSAATITDTSVQLNWSGATDNIGVTAYKLFTNGTLTTTLGDTTTHLVTGLTVDTSYTFTVIASDAAGNDSSSSNAISITTDGEGGSGTSTGDSSFWTQIGSNITFNSGDVGIGTSTIPSGYKLAVDGKIIVEEIKVQISGDWPDYVFTKNYKLPTLDEVQKHIEQNGHLMNIPSAKEAETNGVKLGEMNRLLLEKIEELTIYILQQQEQLNNQQAEIKALKLKFSSNEK